MSVRNKNFGGSWRMRTQILPDFKDLGVLYLLKDLMTEFRDRVRFRIEDPWIQVYAENEKDLQDFANTLGTDNHNLLTEVFLPRSDKNLELLKQGYVVRKKETEYPYKVVVREGRYSRATKQQILTYLQNLGNDAHLPNHFIDNMERTFDSVWNCYFYIKDPGVLTMLALISSGFVGRVEEFRTNPK